MLKQSTLVHKRSELAPTFELIARGSKHSADSWTLDYWDNWLREPERSESTLRPYVLALTSACQQASWRSDFQIMQRMLTVYDAGYRYCTEEPLLTPYELGLMHIALFIADHHLIAGRLANCLSDVDAVGHCLAIGDARRAECGVTPRPNSEVRINCLGLRAACLSDPQAAAALVPAEAIALAQEFWSIADAAITRLANASDRFRRIMLQAAARWEIEICKLCYLINQDLFSEAVARFNQRYEADLSANCVARFEDQPYTAWYWDLEVWKGLRGPEAVDDLARYLDRREAVMRLTYGAKSCGPLIRFWRRQAEAA